MSCKGCNKEIEAGQDGVAAAGAKWHSSCFVCTNCQKPFEKGFVSVGGGQYHQDCVPSEVEIMSDSLMDMKICGGCSSPLGEESFVQVGESSHYHNRCFVCASCQKEISGGEFESHEGRLYHVACAPDQKSCAVCKKAIETKGMVIEGKTYHPDCLTCWGCGGTFDKNFAHHDGKFWHPKCVPAADDEPPCAVCAKPLSNPCVDVEGKQMHSECFLCAKCHRPFTSEYAKNGEQYVHKECA